VHIPDGYLSPATCAVAYAVAVPFWSIGFRRVKRVLHTRAVPLLAMVSAFSFVVMMFNLPIPGGTTAHAVGLGIGAVLLGPWAAMLAVSIALMIQALFFGDGGITAFGANCVNMAIAGPLVAYAVYRLVSGRSAIGSRRRVVAAALAGYAGINVAAFLAACEFGIQPMLFHDATGTPLYAPYPLSLAIPAMMAAHVTVAGAAEAVIAGGLVAYLQRANPELLEVTAARPGGGWRATRALWLGLGAMMVASPLGLLAAGMAWGEWGVEDFQDPESRAQIVAATGNAALPDGVPVGLERLSSLWTAPLPDYAPGFMHDPSFGYIVSAVVGAGLVSLAVLALAWIVARTRGQGPRTPESGAAHGG